MKHDEQCELIPSSQWMRCKCAERAYLASCDDDERAAFENRTGYDRSVDAQGNVRQ